jgi:predicted O-methyltransferase YrrM
MNLTALIRNFTLALFLLNIHVAHALGWSLEHLASDKSLAMSDSYQDPKLAEKMNAVFDAIKGSWCSKEKAKLMMEIIIFERLNTCVEVGTFAGSSALPILVSLEYLNKGHAYLIDAWSNQEAIKGLNREDPNAIWWSALDMKAIKQQLLQMLRNWKLTPYCTVIHATSDKALSHFDSIDFLHLDGNFSEQGALLDTDLYLPKVRPGGYILLSNVLVTANQKPTKMKALWPLFDTCEIVSEIENGNVLLFRKIQ